MHDTCELCRKMEPSMVIEFPTKTELDLCYDCTITLQKAGFDILMVDWDRVVYERQKKEYNERNRS